MRIVNSETNYKIFIFVVTTPVFHSVPLPEKHDTAFINQNLNVSEKIVLNACGFIKGFLDFLFTNPAST